MDRPKRIVTGVRKRTRQTGGVKERVTEDVIAVLETCGCGREFYVYEKKPCRWCAHCQAEDPNKRPEIDERVQELE